MAEEVLECGYKVILDFAIVCIVLIPIIVLNTVVSPFRRGFYCNDHSIGHPYKTDTVPIFECGIIGVIIITIIVPVIEMVRYLSRRKRYSIDTDQVMRNLPSQPHYQMFGHRVHIYVASLYKIIGVSLFGFLICQLTTDVVKNSVGRLRPHFLSVCQPNWSILNCTDQFQLPIYIDVDVCTTSDLDRLEKARLSFPSGHSSFIAYIMVFMILYLQSSLRWRKAPILLRPLLQALCMFTIIYVCASRISDYKHHWSDVLVGAILGFFISLCAFSYISDLFSTRNRLTNLEFKMSELRPTSSQSPHGCL